VKGALGGDEGGTGGGSGGEGGGSGGEGGGSGGVGGDAAVFRAGAYLRQKDTEQVHLCLGFDGVELGDDDNYPLHLANFVFGGGMSSVLFQKIREELGLVCSIYSYISAYRGAGLFTIYAGMQPEQAERVFQMVIDEIEAFKASGMTADLLSRAKEQFKGSFLMGLESPNARMSALGKSELLLGYFNTPEEIVGKIEKVSLGDAHRVIGQVIDAGPSKIAVSAVGKIGKKLDKTLKKAGGRM